MTRAVLGVLLMAVLPACEGEGEGAAVPPAQEFTPSTKRTAECDEGDPARERHGTDCACCHDTQFAAAGSVAAEAASSISHVEAIDRLGQTFFMPPNPYGNFFAHRPRPEMPMRAKLVFKDGSERAMGDEIQDSSCNHCHRPGGEAKMLGTP